MSKTPAEKAAQERYVQTDKGRQRLQDAQRRYEEKRGHRDRAEYMREYLRRKKSEATQPDTPTTP